MLGPTATITSLLSSIRLWRSSCFRWRGGGGRVGHHEASAACCIQRGIEKLDPQVVGVVGTGKAEGKSTTDAYHVLEPLFVHRVDVERRIGEDEVELAGGIVGVVVVTVDVAAVADVTFAPMDGKVEAT